MRTSRTGSNRQGQIVFAGRESLGQVRDFLKSCKGKPYSCYADFTDESLLAYLMDSMDSVLSSPDSTLAICLKEEKPVGVATLGSLNWDTEQFGFKAGRVDYLFSDETDETLEAMVTALDAEAKKMGIRHLSVRLDSSQIKTVQYLEKYGFQTVDAILNFSMKMKVNHDFGAEPGEVPVRLSKPEDIDELKRIAGSSFVHDRFHNDPILPKETSDKLHASWIENSVKGLVDAVLVAEFDGKPQGFITCKLSKKTKEYLGKMIGTIVLVATAKEARGKGAARTLTKSALAWFFGKADIVEVGTQLKNVPASRLYASSGFNLVSTSFSLRKWCE